mmetsp:Transcript_18637/g.71910  ORF Transcript_18637/g.71910 Transcript_18637/m.71910 type:complete len:496 (-) Transcript_18637:1030-2517(-)
MQLSRADCSIWETFSLPSAGSFCSMIRRSWSTSSGLKSRIWFSIQYLMVTHTRSWTVALSSRALRGTLYLSISFDNSRSGVVKERYVSMNACRKLRSTMLSVEVSVCTRLFRVAAPSGQPERTASSLAKCQMLHSVVFVAMGFFSRLCLSRFVADSRAFRMRPSEVAQRFCTLMESLTITWAEATSSSAVLCSITPVSSSTVERVLHVWRTSDMSRSRWPRRRAATWWRACAPVKSFLALIACFLATPFTGAASISLMTVSSGLLTSASWQCARTSMTSSLKWPRKSTAAFWSLLLSSTRVAVAPSSTRLAPAATATGSATFMPRSSSDASVLPTSCTFAFSLGTSSRGRRKLRSFSILVQSFFVTTTSGVKMSSPSERKPLMTSPRACFLAELSSAAQPSLNQAKRSNSFVILATTSSLAGALDLREASPEDEARREEEWWGLRERVLLGSLGDLVPSCSLLFFFLCFLDEGEASGDGVISLTLRFSGLRGETG